jgi:hypothetical protein
MIISAHIVTHLAVPLLVHGNTESVEAGGFLLVASTYLTAFQHHFFKSYYLRLYLHSPKGGNKKGP